MNTIECSISNVVHKSVENWLTLIEAFEIWDQWLSDRTLPSYEYAVNRRMYRKDFTHHLQYDFISLLVCINSLLHSNPFDISEIFTLHFHCKYTVSYAYDLYFQFSDKDAKGMCKHDQEVGANNSQRTTQRKTSISFYASMNEIISPKHSNESKIKADASVIFGGDNKGDAVKHKYNFRHVARAIFWCRIVVFDFFHFFG